MFGATANLLYNSGHVKSICPFLYNNSITPPRGGRGLSGLAEQSRQAQPCCEDDSSRHLYLATILQKCNFHYLSIIRAIMAGMDGFVLTLVALATLLTLVKIVFEIWGDF